MSGRELVNALDKLSIGTHESHHNVSAVLAALAIMVYGGNDKQIDGLVDEATKLLGLDPETAEPPEDSK